MKTLSPELWGNVVALPSPRSGLLTADKREIKDSSKFAYRQSCFTPKPIGEMSPSYQCMERAWREED